MRFRISVRVKVTVFGLGLGLRIEEYLFYIYTISTLYIQFDIFVYTHKYITMKEMECPSQIIEKRPLLNLVLLFT